MAKLVERKVIGLSEDKKRVDSSVFNVALLDEVAERLYKLQTMMEAQIPSGMVEPIEPIAVASAVRIVNAIKPWFCVDIVNDGPNSLFALVNNSVSFEWHEIKLRETYKVDMGRGIIDSVLLKCNPGERASARLIGSR